MKREKYPGSYRFGGYALPIVAFATGTIGLIWWSTWFKVLAIVLLFGSAVLFNYNRNLIQQGKPREE